MKRGRIITNNVSLQEHECETVLFLAKLGKNIELIPPSNTPHARRADFIMDNLAWEMKSPEQIKKEVLERAFDKALKQSCNVVIDLRRAKGKESFALKHLQKCFVSSRRARRLIIVTKRQSMIDWKK